MDFGWIITLVFLLGAATVGYVAYAKVRAGQQPGEAWIDALLAKVRKDKAPVPAPAPAPAPAPSAPAAAPALPTPALTAVLTQADIDRAVTAALASRAASEAAAQPTPTPAPTGGTMHPASNAYLLDPAGNYPDVSPDGYGLYYQVGGDKKPVPGTVPTLSYAGISSFKDKAAIDAWIAASKRRDAALDAWAETWKAETFNGPISVAGMKDKPGDLAYLDARVEDYKVATNRDLFRDVFAGSNPEIMHLRNIGMAHINQGLPYDPTLPGVVDTLKGRHRKG
jgi:hypothetical protein